MAKSIDPRAMANSATCALWDALLSSSKLIRRWPERASLNEQGGDLQCGIH